jgi:hypothetical protein
VPRSACFTSSSRSAAGCCREAESALDICRNRPIIIGFAPTTWNHKVPPASTEHHNVLRALFCGRICFPWTRELAPNVLMLRAIKPRRQAEKGQIRWDFEDSLLNSLLAGNCGRRSMAFRALCRLLNACRPGGVSRETNHERRILTRPSIPGWRHGGEANPQSRGHAPFTGRLDSGFAAAWRPGMTPKGCANLPCRSEAQASLAPCSCGVRSGHALILLDADDLRVPGD